MLLYTTLLNLILIVIVTPSIVNPGPINNVSNDLKVGYVNAQGLIFMSSMKSDMPIFQTNKIMEIQSYLYSNNLDILILNETWLNKYINNNEIFYGKSC